MTTSLKLGALPPTAKPRVHLAPFLTAEEPAPPPHSVDFMSKVPADAWGMLGNDRYGDCAWAGMGHLLQANAAYTNAGDVRFDDGGVLEAYAAETGFTPEDPRTDQGTVLQDALNFMTKTGMKDAAGKVHKILAFAQVNVSDPAEVDRALDLFGALYTGFSVYAFAMAEFEAGRTWSERAQSVRGALEGGHCVPVMKVSVSHDTRTAVTWGRPQPVGKAFWRDYFSEAWVAVTPEWVDVAGKSPSGLDLNGLLAEVDRLRSA